MSLFDQVRYAFVPTHSKVVRFGFGLVSIIMISLCLNRNTLNQEGSSM